MTLCVVRSSGCLVSIRESGVEGRDWQDRNESQTLTPRVGVKVLAEEELRPPSSLLLPPRWALLGGSGTHTDALNDCETLFPQKQEPKTPPPCQTSDGLSQTD